MARDLAVLARLLGKETRRSGDRGTTAHVGIPAGGELEETGEAESRLAPRVYRVLHPILYAPKAYPKYGCELTSVQGKTKRRDGTLESLCRSRASDGRR